MAIPTTVSRWRAREGQVWEGSARPQCSFIDQKGPHAYSAGRKAVQSGSTEPSISNDVSNACSTRASSGASPPPAASMACNYAIIVIANYVIYTRAKGHFDCYLAVAHAGGAVQWSPGQRLHDSSSAPVCPHPGSATPGCWTVRQHATFGRLLRMTSASAGRFGTSAPAMGKRSSG